MESEDDEVTKQIQEYYKKYSQDRKLPKYFSGTSVEYMPEIVSSEEAGVKFDKKSEKAEKAQIDYDEYLENKPISPSSSVTSNRKLEWDNGADIGYSNYSKNKLHKSNSLPSLLSNKPCSSSKDPGSDPTPIITVINLSSSSSEVASSNKGVQSSTSSCPVLTEPSVPSSTTTEAETKKPASSSSSSSNFSNTLAYLKSRIGVPDAESTPRLPIPHVYVETPKPVKPPRKLKKHKVQLCITKPINVECIDVRTKSATNKLTQTSFERKCSKSVQTTGEILVETDRVLEASSSGVTNQSVVLVNYDASESDRKSSTTQTGDASEALASQCDSFEYLFGSRMEEEVKSYGNLKRSETQRDLVTSNSSSSKDPSVLSELSLNVTNKDMEKNIGILKRLLKSKKYDAATKKCYVKKIVKRIVEKDTSTSSSELFVPKQPGSNDSELSNGVKIQQTLQQNVPWYPVHIARNLTAKTFSDEFLPGPSYAASPPRSPRKNAKHKSIFTMAQQSKNTVGSCSTSESHTSLEKQQDSGSQSYRNWKEEKTMSERVLDERKSRGDQLVQFAQKERQHQIEWINDEISHLSKLKGLLEKRYDGVSGGVTRTTTVYVVSSSQRDSLSSGSQRPNCNSNGEASTGKSDSGRPHNRNEAAYVIQTSIEAGSPSDAMVFNLRNGKDGTEYKVSESGAAGLKTRYVGDVEFSSDEKTRTTSVTVRARKVPQQEDTKISSSIDRSDLPATYPRSAPPTTFHLSLCGCSRPTPATEVNGDKLTEIKRRWLNATPGGEVLDPLQSISSKPGKSGLPRPVPTNSDERCCPKSPEFNRHGRFLEKTDSRDICRPCEMRKPPPFRHKCIPCGIPKYQKEVPQPSPFYFDDVCYPCGPSRPDDFSTRLREVCDLRGKSRSKEGVPTREPKLNDIYIPYGAAKRTEILSKKRDDTCLPCGMAKYTERFTESKQEKVCRPCGMSVQDGQNKVCQPCGMPKYKKTFTQDDRQKVCQPCGMSKSPPDKWKEVFSKIKNNVEKHNNRSSNSRSESIENDVRELSTHGNRYRTVDCACQFDPEPKQCAGTQWSPKQSESVIKKCSTTSEEGVKGILEDLVGSIDNVGMSGDSSTASDVIKPETLSDGKSLSSHHSCKRSKSKSIRTQDSTESSSTKTQTLGPELVTRLSQTDQTPFANLGVQSDPQNIGTLKSGTVQTENLDLGSHVIQTDDPRLAINLVQTDDVVVSSEGTSARVTQGYPDRTQFANLESRGTRGTAYVSDQPLTPNSYRDFRDTAYDSNAIPISQPAIHSSTKYAGDLQSPSFSGASTNSFGDSSDIQKLYLGAETLQGAQHLPDYLPKSQRSGVAPESTYSQRRNPTDRSQIVPTSVPQPQHPSYGQSLAAPSLSQGSYSSEVTDRIQRQTELLRQLHQCYCPISNIYGRQGVPTGFSDGIQTELRQSRNQGIGTSTVYNRHIVQTDDPQLIDGRVQTDENSYQNQSSAAQTQRQENMIDGKVQTDENSYKNPSSADQTQRQENIAVAQTDSLQLASQKVQTGTPPRVTKSVGSNRETKASQDTVSITGSVGIVSSTLRKDKSMQDSAVTYRRDQTVPFSAAGNTQTLFPQNSSGISQTDKFYSKDADAQSDPSKNRKMQTDNSNVSNNVVQTENAPTKSKRVSTENYQINVGTVYPRVASKVPVENSDKEMYLSEELSVGSARRVEPGSSYQQQVQTYGQEVSMYDGSTNTRNDKSSLPTTSYNQLQSEELTSYGSRTSESDSESSSSSSESSTSDSTPCICCKRKESGTFYTLRKKLSQHAYPLCKPCFTQNGNWSPHQFRNPMHVCHCYTVIETKTLNEIKQTMNDIDELDNRKCTCSDGRRKSCKHCSCKLRKTRHGKNGIAYMLTFEPESKRDRKKKKKRKHKKRRSLEEIRITVPMYKKHKDKENKKKRERHDEKRYNLQTKKCADDCAYQRATRKSKESRR